MRRCYSIREDATVGNFSATLVDTSLSLNALWPGVQSHHAQIFIAETPRVDCLTPWDVQSRRIYGEDGVWPALYAGDGGGKGYVLRGQR